jgi:hypothetical protein
MGRKEFTQGVETFGGSTLDVAVGSVSTTLADSSDISGGVSASVSSSSFALLISGTGGDTLKIEVSPDGGTSWYETDESHAGITINSNGEQTIQVEYSCTAVRVTNESTALTTVEMVEY